MTHENEARHFFENKNIWLTGATSGIGLSLLEKLLGLGATVIATGRKKDKIVHLLNEKSCFFLSCDFEEKINAQDLARLLGSFVNTLDIVILNAGICEYLDDLEHFNVEFFEKTFRVNYFGLLSGVQASLPLLLKSDAPYLVGMSSAVALCDGVPRSEAYGASKAAIKYTLEALQGHVHFLHPNFAISIVYPGFVKTPLTDKNDFNMPFRISSEAAANIITQKMIKKPPQISFPFLFIVIIKLLDFIVSKKMKIKWFKKSFRPQSNGEKK